MTHFVPGLYKADDVDILPFDHKMVSKQASSFFNKNLTNADNDNSMNMSTKMEMSQVNKPANNVQTMQYELYLLNAIVVDSYCIIDSVMLQHSKIFLYFYISSPLRSLLCRTSRV